MSKKRSQFVYLVQARQDFDYFDALVSKHSDCIVLYWRAPGKRPCNIFSAVHPAWRGVLHLFADGRMERPGIDGGSYELLNRNKLVLKWNRWPPEELLWNDADGVFRDANKAFTLTELPQRSSLAERTWQSIEDFESTWNGGRNRLLKEALARSDFDYLIFMDDDVGLRASEGATPAESFRRFEQFLTAHRPAVGFCSGSWHKAGRRSPELTAPQRFDACFNAIRRDALPVLLPYYEGYDQKSWWWSQEMLCSVAAVVYPGRCMQNNRIAYFNRISEKYPRGKTQQMAVPATDIGDSIICPATKASYSVFPLSQKKEFQLALDGENSISYDLLTRRFDLNHFYWRDKNSWWTKHQGRWF